MSVTTTYQPTEAQIQEMNRLKLSFPFRIVYGAFNPETSEYCG